jgi:hypothetical protein
MGADKHGERGKWGPGVDVILRLDPASTSSTAFAGNGLRVKAGVTSCSVPIPGSVPPTPPLSPCSRSLSAARWPRLCPRSRLPPPGRRSLTLALSPHAALVALPPFPAPWLRSTPRLPHSPLPTPHSPRRPVPRLSLPNHRSLSPVPPRVPGSVPTPCSPLPIPTSHFPPPTSHFP